MELKEILGEDLYNQVTEAVKGKGANGKDIELVAANTGDYVPAKKYDEVKNSLNKMTIDYYNLTSIVIHKLSSIIQCDRYKLPLKKDCIYLYINRLVTFHKHKSLP